MRAFTFGILGFLAGSSSAFAQTVPSKRASEVFRFGGPDAKAPYDFSATPRLVVDSAGFIYARIASDASVIVFRPDGQFVRSIGRKGAGPGEFQVASAHGLIGDTLWVTNWPTPRMSLFRKDGTHLATRLTPFDVGQQSSTAPIGISGWLAGGRAYVLLDALILEAGARVPVLIGTRDMRGLDTVAMIPASRGLSVAGVGSWAFAPMPSSPQVAISSMRSEFAIAEWDRAKPGTVTMSVVSGDGRERWRRELQLAAEPVPSRVRDSLLALGLAKARPQLDAARRRGTMLGASNERLVEEGLDLPTHYPPVRSLVLGLDGTVWLERFGEGRTGQWLVLGRQGQSLFQVQLPASLEVQQASATDVWGTDRDELDVSYLVRFSLAPDA